MTQPKTQGKMKHQIDKYLDGYAVITRGQDFVDLRNWILKEQSTLLQRVIELMPKESHINYHDEDGIRYIHDVDMGISIHWEKGYNKAIADLKTKISQMGEEL